MQRTYISRAFFVLSLLLVPATALGSLNFYRVGGRHIEPRQNKNWLTTVNVDLSGGGAKKGKNGSKTTVNALNIYGNQEISRLMNGTITPTGMTTAQEIVDNAFRAAGNPGPAVAGDSLIAFDGKFSSFDFSLCATQNFTYGFFGRLVVPVTQRNVKEVAISNTVASASRQTDATWVAQLNNLATTLAPYNLTFADEKSTDIGDVELHLGWTYNENSSQLFDFLDATIQVGISTGSGKKKDENKVFSLPAGYDGHVGIPVSFDCGVGFYEWINISGHVGGTFFVKKTKTMRMKTSASQNGFIQLGLGEAKRDLGNLFDVGVCLKADHIAGGLSVAVGYNYTAQKATTLTPTDTVNFSAATASSNEKLQSWNVHAIHACAEYDFSKEGHTYHPTLGVHYNRSVAGKRAFKGYAVGGSAGLNITWKI